MRQKKKWMIPLCVIGGLLLVCAGILWYMVSHSMDFSVGRCLVADNGSYMFIDGNSPIVMSNRKDKEGLFSDLETGDRSCFSTTASRNPIRAGPEHTGV